MAYRLVAKIEDREQRFTLERGEQVVGSHPDCPVRLVHATVSRRHAVMTVADDGVSVLDLGSRNGVRVAAEKVREAKLEPGASLAFGKVVARLEEIPDQDLEAAVVFAPSEGAGHDRPEPGGSATTSAAGPAEEFLVTRLPQLLRRLNEGADRAELAQLVGEALFSSLPCLEVEVADLRADGEALVFSARRPADGAGDAVTARANRAGTEVRVVFPLRQLAERLSPVVAVGAELIALPGPVELRDEAPADPASPPPLPEPPTVEPRLRTIYADAARVARGEVGVLILGESGTGKELLARYVHRASSRAEGPFLGLNCASLPRDLLEAELFGIERGVATGVEERPGTFELASGGTLFLDEIGDMALETQSKILRVLQSGETFRIGGREPRRVDVRVVAATNRDLKAMLASGAFRTDLYHRVATWVVELPPLRERRGDIANLAAHFLAREARRRGISVRGISRAALGAMESHPWPGNVRQLENEMARAVLFLEDGELLDTGRLAEEISAARTPDGSGTLEQVLAKVERDEIEYALAAVDRDVEAAAARLGVSRATLYRRMKALGIGG